MNVTYYRTQVEEKELLALIKMFHNHSDLMKLLGIAWLSYRSIYRKKDVELLEFIEKSCPVLR